MSSPNKMETPKPGKTAKKENGSHKRKLDPDEKLEHSIKTKKKLVSHVDAFDYGELDLRNDEDEAAIVSKLAYRDKLLKVAFEMDYKQRRHVDFIDSESKDQFLDDVLNVVPNPIIIYDTDLEPLNKMLTDFINKPGSLSTDYLIPEFNDVKEMLMRIQEAGDCPLFEHFVPKIGTDAFDEYVVTIMGNVKEKIRRKRFQNFTADFELGIEERLNQIGQSAEQADEEPQGEELGPSSSLTEKLKQLKKEGAITKEEEPIGEDCDDLDDVDLQSDVTSQSSTSYVNTPTIDNKFSLPNAMESNGHTIEEIILNSDSDSDEADDSDSDMEIIEEEVVSGVREEEKSEEKMQTQQDEDETKDDKDPNGAKPTDDQGIATSKEESAEKVEVSTENKIVGESEGKQNESQETIRAGESAISPPISPLETTISSGKNSPFAEPNDDSIIYID